MLRSLSFALLVWLPVPMVVSSLFVSSMFESVGAEEPVFSGPQLGETLPSFQTMGFFGEYEGKSFDLVQVADGGPLLIVFVHELTRPGFALTRAITKFAAERENQGMTVGVVFLSDDLTETVKWAANVRRLFSDKVIYGVSPDGKEGPGSYGLNRNVTLTILVADDGKVTANYALVQPQLEADGTAIVKSIAAVTGGGELPSMEQLQALDGMGMNARRQAAQRPAEQSGARGESDPQLTSLLRDVINKQASEEQVRAAATKVEAYIETNAAARKELARITATVVRSGKIGNYGTPTAQQVLRKWLEVLSAEASAGDDANPQTDNDTTDGDSAESDSGEGDSKAGDDDKEEV